MRAERSRIGNQAGEGVSIDPVVGNSVHKDRTQETAQSSSTPPPGCQEGEAAGYNPVDSLYMNDTGQMSYMGPTSIPLLGHPSLSTAHTFNFSSLIASYLPFSQPDIYFGLDPSTHNDLLDLYFRYLNGWSGFVDETGFRQALKDPTQKAHGYSRFSHVCILGSASHISGKFCSLAPGERSLRFVDAALKMLGRELENPNPCTVNAMVQLSLNACDSGKSSTGWTLAGLAVRISQGLGLGVNTSRLVQQGQMDSSSQRAREDGFWTAYVDDTLNSLYSGRLPSREMEDHDIPLPCAALGPLEDCTGNHPTMELALVTLCAIARRVMHWFYSIRKEKPRRADEVQVMRSDLKAWGQKFDPRAADPPRNPISSSAITCLAFYNTVTLLLNRPFLQRHCLDSRAGQYCLSAAVDTVELMQLFDRQHQMRHAPNLHVAGSFFILLLADLYDQPDRSVQRKQAEEGLSHVVSYLTLLAGSWDIASQALAAIRTMRQEYAVDTSVLESQDNLPQNLPAEDMQLTFDIEDFLRGELGLNLVDLGAFSGDPNLSIIDGPG
uniref:Xylanolytic transcriptional activator regulatory domain-containing protein n=1 Tax=Kwoniella dejecticola CBS 10117 TaxID=1296121 RepID=A0A1A6A3V5_9TREE|nr:uncharacterized protein I303_05599 [Kwoniella dejecticola CBS 10117]OBR84740.1 hypothetical protein I303_05599 [Kwoniella dejecticola CBS 10117]